MSVLSLLLLLLLSFLVGSIPTGLILASRFSDVDIRSAGSGNIGATNVYRLLGKTLGGLTLLGDALKGFLVVALAQALTDQVLYISLVALVVFLGHCYSVFLRFKGGKGVAVALGDTLALTPGAAILALLIWGLMVWRFRKSSLGALVAAPLLFILTLLMPEYRAFAPVTLAIVVLIVVHHRENITRLLHGEER